MTQLTRTLILMFLLRTQQKTISPGSLIIDKGEKISRLISNQLPLTLRVMIYNFLMNNIIY